MKKLTPEIALEKHYELWNAIKKAEQENKINEYDLFTNPEYYYFRDDFKKEWCKQKGENPLNNCYLCEYANQRAKEAKEDYAIAISFNNNNYAVLSNDTCQHCLLKWKGESFCEQRKSKEGTDWRYSPIDEILSLPVNEEEIKKYHAENA